jgi:hypothetical protein
MVSDVAKRDTGSFHFAIIGQVAKRGQAALQSQKALIYLAYLSQSIAKLSRQIGRDGFRFRAGYQRRSLPNGLFWKE